jgi:dolichyl-diphosphooligosaccharide--protein glycosyltransferase
MASSWGGYIFVNNLIGLHAIILVLLGRFSSKIYYAYTLFYIIGTILAMQIPIIGTAPLKSLEQLGPLVIFIVYQIIQYGEGVVRKQKMEKMNAWEYRIKMYTMVLLFTTVMMAFFIPDGYFGPISIRIRGLFVEHSKTGNPLVDSVAEHQPAGSSSYFRYLQHLCIFAPIGLLFSLVKFGDASSFAITFAVVAYYFSLKMVRLILLMGPAASILAGIAIGRITTWSLLQLWIYDEEESNESSESESSISKETKKKKKFGKKNISKKGRASIDSSEVKEDSKHGNIWTRILAAILILLLSIFAASFQSYSLKMARVLSNPSIITFGQKSDGSVVKVDDYREAYWWLRDNTPDDARILAWWDYGYQISALANRTTLADGNTWNHEHVALIGKILTTDADEGYNIARHLADYILIWAGGGGDDLAKSPHLAKIANSVYHGHCKEDSSCSNFGYIVSSFIESVQM